MEIARITLFNLEGTVDCVLKKMEERSGGLAQLGERLPCKQEVSGSIPLISTIFSKRSEECRYGPIAQLARAHD